jgi:anthranilate phosphoribosyltransferase
MNLRNATEEILDHQDLSQEKMESCMQSIMDGAQTTEEIREFLLALNQKGYAVDELVGAAKVMKEKSPRLGINCINNIDTCGTGGTGLHVFNCSSAAGIVVASLDHQVTKHGNKGISSSSGSADFFSNQGANIQHDHEKIEAILEASNFIFLFAPLHHPAMKFVMEARQSISEKTIFNLLGPLTNPLSPTSQVIGLFSEEYLERYAIAASRLGINRAAIVHGEDGCDEVSVFAKTQVVETQNGVTKSWSFNPSDFEIEHKNLADVQVNNPEESSQLILEAFEGRESPASDMIAINAAFAIYAAGSMSLEKAFVDAKVAMKEGLALGTLRKYIDATNQQ